MSVENACGSCCTKSNSADTAHSPTQLRGAENGASPRLQGLAECDTTGEAAPVHDTPAIVPARTEPNVRSARNAAEAATRRIQRVLHWEGCTEDSTLFQTVAQQLEAEFDAEDRKSRRVVVGGAGVDSSTAVNTSSTEHDTFEACSSDEESDDGSYDSSFVVSDGEGETTASSSGSSQGSCAESNAEADAPRRQSRGQDTRSFVITIKRQRTK